jgi:cysteinyl-tRNA synthetase
MSKSKNNFFRLVDFEKENILPLSFRYYVYGFSYGKTANFSVEALKAADVALKNLYNFETKIHFLKDLKISFIEDVLVLEKLEKIVDDFDSAVHNNLDMPRALECV